MTETNIEGPNVPAIEWDWDSAAYSPAWHEPIFDLMKRYIPRASAVLEVGAGGSHTLGAIAGRLDCQAVGIEPDTGGIRKALELADSESAQVTMLRGDGFQLPLAADSFDVVYSLGLIEHFDRNDSSALIREHVRVCKQGGRVIIAVPNFWNLPHTLRKWYLGKNYEYYPEESYRPSTLKEMMNQEGLTIEQADGLAPLWGLSMASWAWRPMLVLERSGIKNLLENIGNPSTRAMIGYMTYVIGRKNQRG